MNTQEIYEEKSSAVAEPAPAALPDEPYYRRQPPSSTSSTRRLGTLLVIIGLVWIAIEMVGYGPFFGGQGSTSITLPLPDNRIELDLNRGDVEIQTTSGTELRIETTQYGLWQGDPLATSQLDDRVLVRNEASPRTFGLCFGRCGLSYRITAPAGVNLIVQTTSGEIDLRGSANEVQLTSTSGDVTVHDLDQGATVTTSSGEVTLSRIAGPLEVQTSSGDVRLTEGQVVDANVQTNSGEIELNGVAGALTVQSNSGDIMVRDAQSKQLDIQNQSGEVDYSGDLAGDSSITTSSGDVELHLPADSNFVLDASTRSGDLDSSFDLQNKQQSDEALSGVAGEGGPTLTITTSSGSVSVE
jgi:hypothetical protein